MSSGATKAECGECGTRLSEGVCPSCALGQLFSGSGSAATVEVGGGDALDVEFGRYTLLSKLASGGMGVVYVAEDGELKRRVALKMIRGSMFAGESELARFRIEAEAAGGLDHPNIIPIYEVGANEGQPFYTMKLIEGESLAARLKREPGGRMEALELAELMVPIARAVQHAHQRGVLHRDLKPGNILTDATGVPWLGDFGLAKMLGGDSSLTMTTDHLGTPNYMPPEVVGGNVRAVSTASDIWALGVILWEALCGEVPFKGAGAIETMKRIEGAEPSVPAGAAVDRDLLTLARRCMEKDPARRPESAGFVAEELERRLRGEPLKVRPVRAGERVLRWVRRKPAWAALAAAVVVGGLGSTSLWMKVETTEHSLSEAEALYAKAEAMSEATQLAVQARQVITESPARALLLAVESVDRGKEGVGKVLPESASVMFETLQQVGGWDVSPRGTKQKKQDEAYILVSEAQQFRPRFSPDGRWCLTMDPRVKLGGDGDSVLAGVFDLTVKGGSGKKAEWAIWEGSAGRGSVVWTGDSRRLVAVGDDGVVREWGPELGGAGVGGAAGREVDRLEHPGAEVARVWLRRGDEAGRTEGFVMYAEPWEEGNEPPPVEGWYQRFAVVFEPSGPRLERGELRGLPDMVRQYSHWRASPDFCWLYQADPVRTSLHQLGQGGEMLGGKVLWEGPRRFIHDVFDEAGGWMAAVNEVNEVLLYDLRAGGAAEVAASERVVYTHSVGVEVVASTDDGKRLALGGRSPEVVVLDLGEEEVTETRLWTKSSLVFALNFSDDGEWLAAGSRERDVMLWPLGDAPEERGGKVLRGLPTAVLGTAFSPDRRSLVATGSGGHFRRWDLGGRSGGAVPQVLAESSSRVTDLAISLDGQWLAAVYEANGRADRRGDGENEPVGLGFSKLIDAESGQGLVLGTHGLKASGVALSREGKWVASAGRDGSVKVWDVRAVAEAMRKGVAAPDPVRELDTSMARLEYDRRLAFAPGEMLYCTCGDGVLFEWDLTNPRIEEAEPSGYGMHSISYQLPDVEVSPDGRWIAVARHAWDTEPVEGWTQVGNMVLLFRLIGVGEFEQVAELPARFLGDAKLSFSGDGRWLAASGAGAGVRVWDLEAEDMVGSMKEAPVSAHLLEGVAFSPGGEWLGIGVSDGRICLWDWRETGELWTIRTDDSHSSLVWLDATRLVSAGSEGELLVWETDMLKIRELALATAGRELHLEERKMLPVAVRREE